MKTTITFKSCGLSDTLNLFKEYECDGVKYTKLRLKNDDEVQEFIRLALRESDCCNSAIFIVHNDNKKMTFGITDNDYIKVYAIYETDKSPSRKKIIADFNKELDFCHCGLIEQISEDLYAIIMN